tara:strand:- start:39703 stop:39942 length:240 start_codon:yes stop_codon:yes gene_type:complete
MTQQTDPQYKLRMPEELRDRLKEAAKDNHRTMNAEIVARLQESFQPSVQQHRVPAKVWEALEDAIMSARRERGESPPDE